MQVLLLKELLGGRKIWIVLLGGRGLPAVTTETKNVPQ